MNFLFRSVVGKLWLTIIGLVAVVLLILTVLLVQFFDRFYYEQQREDLQNLATRVAYIFETYDQPGHAGQTAEELVRVSRSGLTVIGPGSNEMWQITVGDDVPKINVETLLNDPQLHEVFYGIPTIKRDDYPDDESNEVDVVIAAVPLTVNGQVSGAVFLYQTLDVIQQTTNVGQQLILYAAGIGILLTTVFAFFLSSRITSPLRQMRMAADNMAEGDFQSRVPIRSRDEIGNLARTLNRMAKQLNDSIHALSQEKGQLSSILRSMVDGVLTMDRSGQVILMNPQAETMVNTWKYEEDIDDNSEVLPRALLVIFEKVLQTQTEHVHSIAAQGRFWTIVMAPLYNQDSVRGAVAVIRDMTEEKRLDKLREDFVANVSHELRTPLSMLQGYSEALVDDVVRSPDERKEMAQIIYDESLRMGRLVNELLDLARMQGGHLELDLQPVQIEQLLSKTVHKFSNLAKEQGIDIVEHIASTQHAYEVDPDRLEQVFTNLIDNAMRHVPQDGKIEISLTEDFQAVHIAVTDTGSGIPEEDLAFVFERFYKADKARTRGEAGTGLGLSIVKHIIEAHQGRIQVHSRVGKGTTFSIQIPRADIDKQGNR